MSCPAGQHRFPPGSFVCAACGAKESALASGGLPYPSWVVDPAYRLETRRSLAVRASDPRSGRSYIVREYFPEVVVDPVAQRRRFITVAKSLRLSGVRSMRLLFAYTRGGRCYTVADPLAGLPLPTLTAPGRVSEQACVTRLERILSALHDLHTAGGAAGPLFHGSLRREIIVAEGSAPEDAVDLAYSLYLENQLSENPLPPEHFQELDRTAAADIVLELSQGSGSAADRQLRLQRIAGPVLGSTLEFLYGTHGTRPSSAKAALDYLHLLQRAASGQDRQLFQQAQAISPSLRLTGLVAGSRPSAPPPRPAPTLPVAPRPQPAPSPPPFAAPPPFQPVSAPPPPVSVPGPAPVTSPAPKQPKRSRSGCGGCLLTLLLALLVAGGVIAVLTRSSTPTRPVWELTATPNPAPRNAHVLLQWHSSGFTHLKLDGHPVDNNGSLSVVANAPHRYALTGIRPDGTLATQFVDLEVIAKHLRKPAAGLPLTGPSEPPFAESAAGNAAPFPFAEKPAPSQASAPETNTGARISQANTLPDPRTPSPVNLSEVNATLGQWASAMLSNDPDHEAAFYAPVVDRYFKQSGVTQDEVRRNLTQVRDGGRTFSQFQITNLSTAIEPDDSVEARFNKEITLMTPSGPKHQMAHAVVHLKHLDGQWRITSERAFDGFAVSP